MTHEQEIHMSLRRASPSTSQNRGEASSSGTIVPSSASFGGGSRSISEPSADGNATVGRCM